MTLDLEQPPIAAPAAPAALLPPDPAHRLRRTRRTETLRAFVRETRIHPRELVAPHLRPPGRERTRTRGVDARRERVSPDEAAARRPGARGARHRRRHPVRPARHEGRYRLRAAGTRAGIVQETLRRLRDADLDLVLIADTCLCEYTDHGHCGPLAGRRLGRQRRDHRSLAEAASPKRSRRGHRRPDAMMDGQVAAIRSGLDARATRTPRSSPMPRRRLGLLRPVPRCRRHDAVVRRPAGLPDGPGQRPRVLREMDADVAEGADMLLVKPALPSLDLLAAARARYDVPIGAYQVSGEFA